jgi:hypothetical protein
VVAGVVLGLGVVAVLIIAFGGSDGDEVATPPSRTGAAAASGPATSPATSPEPSAQSSPSGRTIQLPAGIEVVVPNGWEVSFTEGSKSASFNDDFGNSVLVIGGVGDQKPGDAADSLTAFQTAILTASAGYSDINTNGPEHLDPAGPVTSSAQLTYTATFTDTSGRDFPRQGRMNAELRDDGGGLLLMVESKGGALEANRARWGPIVDSALTTFAASG